MKTEAIFHASHGVVSNIIANMEGYSRLVDEAAKSLTDARFGVPGVSWTVVKNLSLFEHVRQKVCIMLASKV